METIDMGSSIQFNDPTWNGDGFNEEAPNTLWLRLPEILQSVVMAEVIAGNKILSVLENKERGIVLISLEQGPLTEIPTGNIFLEHTSHEYGNYCYDGTKVTYEDVESGYFLAFEDPEYEEDAF